MGEVARGRGDSVTAPLGTGTPLWALIHTGTMFNIFKKLIGALLMALLRGFIWFLQIG